MEEKNKNRLKELRQKEGISLVKLSSKLETDYNIVVTDGQLSQYENRKREPRDHRVWEALAKYFSVSIPYLLGYETSDVGKRLRELREMSCLSIERVSKELNIPEETWRDFENSDNFTLGKNLAKEIAHYFDVDVEFLLGKTTIPNAKKLNEFEKSQYIQTHEEISKMVKAHEEEERNRREFEEEQKKNNSLFKVDYSKAKSESENEETTETPEDSYLMSLENRLANIEILYDQVASGKEVPKGEILPYIAYVAKSVKNEIELFIATKNNVDSK